MAATKIKTYDMQFVRIIATAFIVSCLVTHVTGQPGQGMKMGMMGRMRSPGPGQARQYGMQNGPKYGMQMFQGRAENYKEQPRPQPQGRSSSDPWDMMMNMFPGGFNPMNMMPGGMNPMNMMPSVMGMASKPMSMAKKMMGSSDTGTYSTASPSPTPYSYSETTTTATWEEECQIEWEICSDSKRCCSNLTCDTGSKVCREQSG